MEFVQKLRIFWHAKNGHIPKVASVKIWRCLAQQVLGTELWLKMSMYRKVKVTGKGRR